jgi:hypothetical protein
MEGHRSSTAVVTSKLLMHAAIWKSSNSSPTRKVRAMPRAQALTGLSAISSFTPCPIRRLSLPADLEYYPGNNPFLHCITYLRPTP